MERKRRGRFKAAKSETERINDAIELAVKYGQTDGDHHRLWVIDQMLRALAGENYDMLIKNICEGEDGPNTYEWVCGVAP